MDKPNDGTVSMNSNKQRPKRLVKMDPTYTIHQELLGKQHHEKDTLQVNLRIYTINIPTATHLSVARDSKSNGTTQIILRRSIRSYEECITITDKGEQFQAI
jgi:hypothetical protein